MEDKADNPPSQPGLESTVHQSVREQHRDERTEDYVEAIYRLEDEIASIRIVDLQKVFGVSHVTVIRALEKLSHEQLLTKDQDGISLTPRGRQLARSCFARHHLVESFLLALGVSQETATRDSEGIEHHLSDETLNAFKAYLDKLPHHS